MTSLTTTQQENEMTTKYERMEALQQEDKRIDVRVKFDSIVVGGPIVCDFGPQGRLASFHGGFGGIGIGGGDYWGKAAFNYGVDWLGDQKWKARFFLSAGDAGLIIKFTGMGGEDIGSIMAEGYSGNEVIAGGEGSFFRA